MPGARRRTHLPRDFIPMKRFSTMSMRPTPCFPLKRNGSLGLGCWHKAWGQRPPTVPLARLKA